MSDFFTTRVDKDDEHMLKDVDVLAIFPSRFYAWGTYSTCLKTQPVTFLYRTRSCHPFNGWS